METFSHHRNRPMRLTSLRAITLAATVLAAACSAGDSVAPRTTAPARVASAVRGADASTDTTSPAAGTLLGSTSRSIDGYQWVSCAANGAGEWVQTAGEIRYRARWFRDSSGIYHVHINSNTSQLTGVGTTTGDAYRGTETERVTARAAGYSGFESLRIAENVHYVATGGGANFTIQYDDHVELDANGNLVLWVESQRTTCE